MTTVATYTCAPCEGSGFLTCEDCNGYGEIEFDILEDTPPKGHLHFTELMQIHKDAILTSHQAARLIEMKPAHAESYERQLTSTLETLTERATALLNSNPS